MAQTYEDKPTLAAWNALAEGGAKIAYGAYVGDGTYGEEHPTTLTFDFEPKLVIVQNTGGTMIDVPTGMDIWGTLLMLRGVTRFLYDNLHQIEYLTWDGNSVSWYNASSAPGQFNQVRYTYAYIAIG